MKWAVIGGSGIYSPDLLEGAREGRVETPFGQVFVKEGTLGGQEVVFLPRHGSGHSLPPHRINYRANIWSLRLLGVQRVLATAAVGSLREDLSPGTFVLVHDFIDLTKSRSYTFYEGGEEGVVHTDFSQPYSPDLRRAAAGALKDLGVPFRDGGVYVCTEGPRYETAAEVRLYRGFGGDVVGMTNVPEVVLARELDLEYALIALVTNYGTGLSPRPLSHEEVVEVVGRGTKVLQEALRRVILSGGS